MHTCTNCNKIHVFCPAIPRNQCAAYKIYFECNISQIDVLYNFEGNVLFMVIWRLTYGKRPFK